MRFTREEDLLHALFLKSPFIKEMGLFDGRIGIAIALLEHGRRTDNPVCSDFGDYLLEGLLDKVDKRIGYGLAAGLSGIGWGIEYLVQHGFVACQSDEVCREIDELVLAYDIRRLDDYSLRTGAEGLLHYVLARIKGNISQHVQLPFDCLYLKEWQDKLTLAEPTWLSPEMEGLKQLYSTFMQTGNLAYEMELFSLVGRSSLGETELGNDAAQRGTSEKLGLASGLAGILVHRSLKS